MILETSAVGSLESLQSLLCDIERCCSSPEDIVVLLHFGVNSRATSLALERRAFNEADFRIPDERHYQPERQPIIPAVSSNISTSFETSLPLAAILKRLQCQYDVQESNDAGRFVCNWIYCHSLAWSLGLCGSSSQVYRGAAKKFCHPMGPISTILYVLVIPVQKFYSLFAHVPPFEILSVEKQLDFVRSLMLAIASELSTLARPTV